MRPAVGCSRSSTSFAVVVLPQPDSPTRPSVLPGSMVNEMSSTALTTAVARAKSPRRTGKCLVRFVASRTGPAMLAGKPAAAGMSVGHAELGRCLRAAPVHDFRAARVERAAARERGGVWRLAVDRGEPRAAVAEARDGLEERPGVRMRRRVVDPRHGAGLDEAAPVHHRDLVAHLGHDAEVVGDEDEREVVRALEVAQEVQVLRLDREIEAGRRLVGGEQARLARDRDRPDDALAHPARELMGILAHTRLGRRDADRLQQLLRPAPGAAPARPIIDPDTPGALRPHPASPGQRPPGAPPEQWQTLAAGPARTGGWFPGAGPAPH